MTTQLEEITKELEDGVYQVFSSENYLAYLQTMAKFHNYSFSNSVLIWHQCPQATLVAGYYTWKNSFHRSVKKGEKAIKIIAPIHRKKMYPIILDNEVIEDNRPLVLGFRCVNVFDYSQTTGDDLPFYMKDVLPGMVKDYEHFKDALELISPVPIRYEELDTNAHGYYCHDEKDIVISNSMSEVQTIKTMIHEITHAILHEDQSTLLTRDEKEVQAESVAYSVCSYYGIDTKEYSFPYIAGWSSSKDLEELKESLALIRQTTDTIIRKIELVRNPTLPPVQDYSFQTKISELSL